MQSLPQNEKKNIVTSSEKRRLNLESLKEAQIYGLPIIPFPYSEQNSRQNTEGKSSLCNTPSPPQQHQSEQPPQATSNHYYFGHMNQKRLITAATDIRPSRKMNYRVPVTTTNTINRRLNFDQDGFCEMSR